MLKYEAILAAMSSHCSQGLL